MVKSIFGEIDITDILIGLAIIVSGVLLVFAKSLVMVDLST